MTFSPALESTAIFPISRDPPEGGTWSLHDSGVIPQIFQFLGIPPKGELFDHLATGRSFLFDIFQFLGIPPKGEPAGVGRAARSDSLGFPISRDPPEGGTMIFSATERLVAKKYFSNF